MYWSPRFSALVLIFFVLSPVLGSVTAKQARCVPAMSGGSMRSFCASLPNTTTGLRPKMFMCTAEAPEKPAPDSAIVCIITAASAIPRPAPPNSSGIAMPSQPSRAIAWWKSAGNPPSRSRRSQYSSSKRVQSFAIASRMRCCSSESPKSTLFPLLHQPDDPERDEDEGPPRADDVPELGEPEIAQVVREEEEPEHDEHDRPDEVAPVRHYPAPTAPLLTKPAISPSSKPSSTRISRECSPSFGVRRRIAPPRRPFAHTGNAA